MDTETCRLEILSEDDDTTAKTAQQLRANLSTMDCIHSIERDTPPAQDGKGAKGDALAFGALILALAPNALSATVEFLKDWLRRRRSDTIRLKLRKDQQVIELEYNPATADVDQLISLVQTLSPKDDA